VPVPRVTALTLEGNRRAVELLGRATDQDPEHAMTIALAAWCHAQRDIYQFANNVSEERARAAELASRALQNSDDGPTFAVLGHALSCADGLESMGLVGNLNVRDSARYPDRPRRRSHFSAYATKRPFVRSSRYVERWSCGMGVPP